jgi:type I restriction-modification system DNA methylase subunit
MKNIFDNYIRSISSKFSHKETSEMGYRADFEILLKEIFKSINVKRIDHDARAIQGNKPDFVVLNHDVPILYIEAKDIGVPLDKVEKSEQMARYYGYANLVLTDYVEFRFYRNGLSYEDPIKIAHYDLKNRTIKSIPENYDHLAKTLLDFAQSHKEPIRSGEHLSKIMGGKAQRIRDNVKQFLSTQAERNVEITRIYDTIKKLLVHDLSKDSFADMYAQTLVYGLFVARYHDATPETFTRQEARDLVPASNPLLRHFFDHIVGPNFDKRLEYIVNELCLVFSHANVPELMKQYFKNDLWGKTHEGPDPVIHFYEDFLKEYDPELRKKLGAFYTPLPVVRFIVRSVDYLLEKDFGLASGLADTSKLASGIHRVQILDPAVGTGTFISATIRTIYKRLLNSGQKGRWPTYVHHDLLPRLHGFELMMAPYTIAHLKLSMAFKETGFWNFHRRLGIYLTNSLEEGANQTEMFMGFGLAESIAEESKEAATIKNDMPIMIVIGNPPYAGESSNASYKGNDVYKVEPKGGKLQERNSKWLNDDYVKFIRFAESMIEKTGEGVVAMITAHGYLDNPTFRGMRYHLMKTFNKIYVIDLHGNANKKEKAPDGSDDKNVFDIKQGVAIFLGVKKYDQKNNEVKIFRDDCFGSRPSKFEYLDANTLDSVKWNEVVPSAPNYEWVVRDTNILREYQKGFSVDDLFSVSSVGIVTSRDDFVIDYDEKNLKKRINDFLSSSTPQEALTKFGLKENIKWKAVNALKHNFDEKNIVLVSYRPFDNRYVYYSDDFIERSRRNVMSHFLSGDNLGFVTVNRSPAETPASYYFLTRNLHSNGCIRSDSVSIDTVFPIYLYFKDGARASNLKKEIVAEIENIVGKTTPEDIFDYFYATLHSPSYREKYKEFLKIDFPRVPYPKDANTFKKLVALGTELRALHLLESPKINKFVTTYPVAGSDTVENLSYKNEKVIINSEQYFGNVPAVAWNFYIGGYQPAQKWLKDRKGRALTNTDIEHYQKIIVALTETDRIMKEIDG